MILGIAVIAAGVASSSPTCLAGAKLYGPALTGTVLAYDRYLVYRVAAFEPTICPGNQSLEYSDSINIWGLNYGVFQPSKNAGGHSECGNGFSQIFSGGLDNSRYRSCTPHIYSKYPHDCALGDWSGKFGPMLIPAVKTKQNDTAIFDTDISEIRVLEDQTPISSCFLSGLEVRVYCPTGEIAACGIFEPLMGDGSPAELMQMTLNYIVRQSGASQLKTERHDSGFRDWASHVWSDTQKKTARLWNRAMSASTDYLK